MIRIYLDTNVFSKFKRGELEHLFNRLQELHEKKTLIFYSQAHLNDLSRDSTDNKYQELQVMKKLCSNNFLQYDFEKDYIRNPLAFPHEAYEYFIPEDSSFEKIFSEVFSIDEETDESGLIKASIDYFMSQEVDLELDKHRINSTTEAKEILKSLGITKSRFKMSEWIEIVGQMMDKFGGDNSIIKNLRRLSKEYLEVEKFNVNIDDVNFNQNLAKTQLGKSFLELLEEQVDLLKPKDGQITRYSRISTAFNMLNFFGFDNEKNKKVKFLNTQHDGEHCIYGSICDVVVSDDKGFRQKTKFLYNLYKLDTLVYSVEEFIKVLPTIIDKDVCSVKELNELVNYDLENGLIISVNTSIIKEQKNDVIKLRNRYFNHFNRLSRVSLISDNSKYLVLYRNSSEIYSQIFTKDYKNMIDRLHRVFGADDFFRKGFDEKDQEQLDSGNWIGRTWTYNETTYRLLRNPDSGKINLQIGPLKNGFGL